MDNTHWFTILWLGLWGNNTYVVERAIRGMNLDLFRFIYGDIRTLH